MLPQVNPKYIINILCICVQPEENVIETKYLILNFIDDICVFECDDILSGRNLPTLRGNHLQRKVIDLEDGYIKFLQSNILPNMTTSFPREKTFLVHSRETSSAPVQLFIVFSCSLSRSRGCNVRVL
jgi:hypothetical protein